MALLIGAVLAILSIAVVIYPFLKPRSRTPVEAPAEGEISAEVGLESIYEAIRTLQLEYQLGKVPEGLYQEQLQAYRIQAAATLREQAQARSTDPEWVLEQEILVARAGMAGLNGKAVTCPECGATATANISRCPGCNTELNPPSPISPGKADDEA